MPPSGKRTSNDELSGPQIRELMIPGVYCGLISMIEGLICRNAHTRTMNRTTRDELGNYGSCRHFNNWKPIKSWKRYDRPCMTILQPYALPFYFSHLQWLILDAHASNWKAQRLIEWKITWKDSLESSSSFLFENLFMQVDYEQVWSTNSDMCKSLTLLFTTVYDLLMFAIANS